MRFVPHTHGGLAAALALAAATCHAQPASAPLPAPAASDAARWRGDDESMNGAIGKALVGALLVAGAGAALVPALRRRVAGSAAGARQARLRAVAHLRLGPRCTLHLVEADGQPVLVATGEEAHVVRLDRTALDPEATP